ncbi:dihydrolipoamide acetyltransferase family protein [Paenibacillus koleovorans]|uniref:dihydrolipoamide acetyltransferase family protein n=1 Tax=Paenibacillus koleovorans TaxID=121608 RepID=UPI000FD96FA6|nr:dihydrolipoamide acetyltransferase family protein [Paenibacillus koleovorans]
MSKLILLPKLSLTMDEGKIAHWIAPLGKWIAKDDVIAEIETDKAVVELPMPEDGVIERFLVEAGEEVLVGAPIAILLGKENAPLSAPPPKREESPTFHVAASPSARRRARELGVDYRTLTGSGPGSRIVHRDIEFAASQQASADVAPPVPSSDAVPKATAGTGRKVPLSPMRRTIAKRMLESVQTIPQFSITRRVDVTSLLNLKQLIQSSLMKKQIKLSLTDFIIQAVADTLLEHPSLNASFIGHPQDEECHIALHEHVHVGLAVSVDNGLVVPVIHEAEKLSVAEIASMRMERVNAIRNRTHKASDLQGGTVTVSNLGAYEVEQFQAIVNPPESLILAVGAVREEVMAISGKMEVRTVMQLTGSFDHRVIDGAPAAEFMRDLVNRLQSADLRLI